MARNPKSQWDFGELFPAAETRRVLSVGDLTTQIKRSLEKNFSALWVSGEISNYRLQSSGHAYFVLKDSAAQLQCVLFRGQAGVDRAALRDGAKVLLGGEITVYEPRGQYQLRVSSAELQGIGALQAAFEKLKLKLSAEGLFDPARKRPLPRFPRRIGLVTSPTGAAIRDVLHVIERRFPQLELVLASSRVQGDGAATEVAGAIHNLNRWSASKSVGQGLDLILVTRGGGSLEDLWAFNEEIVARAIASSALPVVSAVGHEIDFTIADFVADVRAATPSAAAEIITENYVASRGFVTDSATRLTTLVAQRLARLGEQLEAARHRLARCHPRRRLEEHGQRLDELQWGLGRNARRLLKARRTAWESGARRLTAARLRLAVQRRREALSQLTRQFSSASSRRLADLRHRLTQAHARLELLSPQNVLDRGYSITVEAETGKVVREAAQLAPGQKLRTRVKSGEIRSTVDPAG